MIYPNITNWTLIAHPELKYNTDDVNLDYGFRYHAVTFKRFDIISYFDSDKELLQGLKRKQYDYRVGTDPENEILPYIVSNDYYVSWYLLEPENLINKKVFAETILYENSVYCQFVIYRKIYTEN